MAPRLAAMLAGMTPVARVLRWLPVAVAFAVALAGCDLMRREAQPDPALDPLFAELALAQDAEEAAAVAQRIEAAWSQTGSAVADVLAIRAERAQASGDFERAQAFLDEAQALAPEATRLRAQRAALAFARGDLEEALAGLEETLAQEPRHYDALYGLGTVLERLGRPDAAMDAYGEALIIHPHFEPAREALERLRGEAQGDAI